MVTPYGNEDIEGFFRVLSDEMNERIERVEPDELELTSMIDSVAEVMSVKDFYDAYAVFVSIIHHFEDHRRRGDEHEPCGMVEVCIALANVAKVIMSTHDDDEDESGVDAAEAADAFLRQMRGMDDGK